MAHCKPVSLIKLSKSYSYASAPSHASHRRHSAFTSGLQTQQDSVVLAVTAEMQVNALQDCFASIMMKGKTSLSSHALKY